MPKPTMDELRADVMQSEDHELRETMLDALDGVEKIRNQRKRRKAGETRGGAREGAGRPKKEGEKATEKVYFVLTPYEVDTLLQAHGLEGESIHKVCQRLVRDALEQLAKDDAA